MKRYLFSLCCAAVASTAWAESPGATVPAPEVGNVVPAGTTAAAAVITGTMAPAATGHGGHCEGGSCPRTKAVCVSQPATVTKTKVVFSSDCETKCHKALFHFLKKDCDSCPDGHCGRAYVERYLYKRVQTEVCDSYKCVPTHAPACDSHRCANGKCAGAAVAATGQPAPVSAPDNEAVPARAIISFAPDERATIGPAVAVTPGR